MPVEPFARRVVGFELELVEEAGASLGLPGAHAGGTRMRMTVTAGARYTGHFSQGSLQRWAPDRPRPGRVTPMGSGCDLDHPSVAAARRCPEGELAADRCQPARGNAAQAFTGLRDDERAGEESG